MPDLHSSLNYAPKPLGFGTSGRRGLIADLTQLEIYINVTAELEYLLSLSPEDGGIRPGDDFYYALDLRPSSPRLMEAVAQAIEDAGMRGISLGQIPTPALMYYALAQGKASIMITGSHIPFDRNGYKLNTSRGELLKEHEAPIGAKVAEIRARIYAQDFDQSPFDESGALRKRCAAAPASDAGRERYAARYLDFFPAQPGSLEGRRILVYQHSAVGRDLLVEVLTHLGADIIPAGRSDTFVPIDTENIGADQLDTIGKLASHHPNLWAVVSTDGDSDRPLLLAYDSTGQLKFFGGDLVGMITAQYLNAGAVVVPVTCNDAIDQSALAPALQPKTRIGSPYVVAGMAAAAAKGSQAVCGWEANGGFLLGADVTRHGRTLTALATRDAFLPILSVLYAAAERDVPVAELFSELPRRFSRAGLLKDFPREISLRITERLSRPDSKEIAARIFTPALGFTSIDRFDYTDGVRIIFANNEVAHIRASGNADELRIYAVADTQARADAIVAEGIREPDGILRSLQQLV
ncbi:MAG TPA: phosphomannomutase [Bryobacteraceae bacterium]|jgi:phosphomannomutase